MEFIRSYKMVAASLRPEQKLGVSRARTLFLMRGGLQGTPRMIRQHAMSVLRLLFPLANSTEIDRLTLYFLTRVAASIMKQAGTSEEQKMRFKGTKEMTYAEATAKRDNLSGMKDSLNEMNEMDMFMLQQMMEKKGQLESMISNVMKAGYEGGQAAIQALKAS